MHDFSFRRILSISSCMIKAEEGNKLLWSFFFFFFFEIGLLSVCSWLMDSSIFTGFFLIIFLLVLLRCCVTVVIIIIILLQEIFAETLSRSQIQKEIHLYLSNFMWHTHTLTPTHGRNSRSDPSKTQHLYPALIPGTMTTMTDSFQPLQLLECFGICGPNWNNVFLGKYLSQIIAFN